ncbi:MAG: HEAT repeat domain-containing protein [Deltaproteobacteria bacterium]|nr:HEAT repeat domain-containing protein [Deltaproteobacteria bacterium]
MGLFGFGGGAAAKIDKLKKKATNKYGQAIERTAAMRSLYDMGSPEALEALLMRYTINVDVTITDADEKRQVYEWLVAAGDKAIGPIERFVSQHDGVYWPLRALKEIAGIERAVTALLAALDRAETLETRVNEQKVQLVSNLRDFPHPKVLERLKALCQDKNDEVRLMAIDGVMTYGPEEALPIVAERLEDPEETHRVLSVLFEQLVEQRWSLAPWKAELEQSGVIPPHYKLDGQGVVVRAR